MNRMTLRSMPERGVDRGWLKVAYRLRRRTLAQRYLRLLAPFHNREDRAPECGAINDPLYTINDCGASSSSVLALAPAGETLARPSAGCSVAAMPAGAGLGEQSGLARCAFAG